MWNFSKCTITILNYCNKLNEIAVQMFSITINYQKFGKAYQAAFWNTKWQKLVSVDKKYLWQNYESTNVL